MDHTDRFHFAVLGPGDAIADEGYKFSDADRRLLDRLLEHALEHHVHSGATATDETPLAGPSLQLHTTGGGMPAGQRAHYRYTYVDTAGNESGPSPMAFIDTPVIVADPAGPALAWADTGGTLPPGSYAYVLSAYTGATTLETRGGVPAQTRINVTTATNTITLSLPALPTGADGFNLYRRKPGAPHYYFLASTTGATYVDDGAVVDDPVRTLPRKNTTNNANAVTVMLPGATPAVPAGATWKIYRSFNALDWTVSGLVHVVQTTFEDSGDVVTTFDDVGEPTSLGGPPDASQTFGEPPKIVLTDSAHVQGSLPPGRNVIPQLVRLEIRGPVVVGTGYREWFCEYDRFDIIWCRAFLQGDGSVPAAQDLIVDVNKYDANAATPGWDTIYTDQANRPRITVGEQLGATAEPDVIRLVSGDALTVDVDQAGGGATPTDSDLVVDVFGYAMSGSTISTYVFAP